jgi:hypothetical protein
MERGARAKEVAVSEDRITNAVPRTSDLTNLERSFLAIVLIVGPKLFIEPGTKAFSPLSSVSGPGL